MNYWGLVLVFSIARVINAAQCCALEYKKLTAKEIPKTDSFVACKPQLVPEKDPTQLYFVFNCHQIVGTVAVNSGQLALTLPTKEQVFLSEPDWAIQAIATNADTGEVMFVSRDYRKLQERIMFFNLRAFLKLAPVPVLYHDHFFVQKTAY